MIEERILSAVERIDGAMTRIEAVARRPASPAPPAGDPAELSALRERHSNLRTRVEVAIAELDVLMRNG